MIDIKGFLIGLTIGCIATFLICNYTSNKEHEEYILESKKEKEALDSINFISNIKIDSLIGVIDSISPINDSIEIRIVNRAKKDIINYENIMQSNPDSSYISVKRYLDSTMSDTTR